MISTHSYKNLPTTLLHSLFNLPHAQQVRERVLRLTRVGLRSAPGDFLVVSAHRVPVTARSSLGVPAERVGLGKVVFGGQRHRLGVSRGGGRCVGSEEIVERVLLFFRGNFLAVLGREGRVRVEIVEAVDK